MYIRLMTYNFYCRPRYQFLDNQVNRAKNIGKVIETYEKEKGYKIDVLLLQEIFDNKVHSILKKELKKIGFLYKTKRLSKTFKLNGGVITYSRYPILEEDKYIFKKAQIFNAMSAKGVIYTKIMVYDKIFHIFNTHLDSFSKDIRLTQMEHIKKFIENKEITDQEFMFLGGDFNINIHDKEVDNINKTFCDYNLIDFLDDEYTMDSRYNDLIKRRNFNNIPEKDLIDIFIYKGKNIKELKEPFVEIKVKEEDYMDEEYEEIHDMPVSGKIIKFKKKDEINNIMFGTSFFLNFYSLTKSYKCKDMSDHYATLCEFCV